MQRIWIECRTNQEYRLVGRVHLSVCAHVSQAAPQYRDAMRFEGRQADVLGAKTPSLCLGHHVETPLRLLNRTKSPYPAQLSIA